ncbi:MAG: DUF2283 domain-containing protein [Elusimicrobiota bacterium]
MAEATLTQRTLGQISDIVPYLVKFPAKHFWVDYDKNADVLYISLNRPQNATNSKMLNNGILLRYNNRKLVGITILEASKRK